MKVSKVTPEKARFNLPDATSTCARLARVGECRVSGMRFRT